MYNIYHLLNNLPNINIEDIQEIIINWGNSRIIYITTRYTKVQFEGI